MEIGRVTWGPASAPPPAKPEKGWEASSDLLFCVMDNERTRILPDNEENEPFLFSDPALAFMKARLLGGRVELWSVAKELLEERDRIKQDFETRNPIR